METLVIVAVVAMLGLTFVILAGGMDRVRRVPGRTVVREPERVVEREVSRPVVTERITERTID